MSKKFAAPAVALACLLVANAPSFAATEIFLKITSPSTFPGEATAAGYSGDIQLLSYSQSVQSPATVGSGSGGLSSGKPSCGNITMTKNIDKSSPQLIKAVMTGERINTATIYFADTVGNAGATGAGGGLQRTQNDYTVTLSDAIVTGVQQSDATPSELVETVTMVVGTYTIHYVPFGRTGAAGAAVDYTVDCTGGLAF